MKFAPGPLERAFGGLSVCTVQLKIQLANPLLPYLNLERMSDGRVTTTSRNLR